MDEWESLRLKIKELETNFLEGHVAAGEPLLKPPAEDYWKRKYEQEKEGWEKALDSKSREQAYLQERYVKDEEGVAILSNKIQLLEKKLDSERALWEEKSRVKILESEIEAVRKEWEEKTAMLMRQNKLLQDKLDMAPEKAIDELKAAEELKADKLKAERTVKALEEQIQSLKKESETKFRGVEEEKKILEDTLSKLAGERAQTQVKISRLEEEAVVLRGEKDRALERLEARKLEFLMEFEDLTQGLSHKIKNHLGIMTGAFSESFDEAGADPARKTSAGFFRDSSQELFKLMDEFLEFSRVPMVEMREMDMNVLAARAIARQMESIQAKKIILGKNFSASLPKIRGDEDRIVRALEEIISNAVDSMPEGKVLTLSVALQEKERLVTATIRDEGPGIAHDLLEKICRPLFTMRKGRRGMGLARARRCMDIHNGFLRISSAENEGTTVILEFPMPD